MKLFWCPQTRSVRALWLMEEAGVPYEAVKVNIRDGSIKSNTEMLSASPMGKVPALIDGAVRIWDSGAIAAYVADQYPAAGLAPAIGHPDRGAYLMWLMYTNSVLEPAMTEKATNAAAAPSRNGWGSWDQMLSTLHKGLEKGPWILGERFSAADVLLGSSCHFMRRFGILKEDPVLFAYADRCAERPAFKKAWAMEEKG